MRAQAARVDLAVASVVATIDELVGDSAVPAAMQIARSLEGGDGPSVNDITRRTLALSSEWPRSAILLAFKSQPVVSEAAPEGHVLSRIRFKRVCVGLVLEPKLVAFVVHLVGVAFDYDALVSRADAPIVHDISTTHHRTAAGRSGPQQSKRHC